MPSRDLHPEIMHSLSFLCTDSHSHSYYDHCPHRKSASHWGLVLT